MSRSGTCLVPLQTGGHNPLMDTVVPLCTLRACVRAPVQNLERDRRKPLGCVSRHPVQMPRFCPLHPVSVSGVIDPSHQLVLGRPDLIYPQRGACLWADGPLWTRSSSSSSYKLALVSVLPLGQVFCLFPAYPLVSAYPSPLSLFIVLSSNLVPALISQGSELTASE